MKKISKFIVISLIFLLFSYFLSYIVIVFFTNSFQFTLSKEYLLYEPVLILAAIIFIIAFFLLCLFLIKSKLVGFKETIERTDKTKSSMYGSSEWQSQKDIDNNYKRIKWEDVPTIGQSGFIINTRKENKSFYVNAVYEKHSLIVAATRVGKSKYYISPNIQYLANCPNKPSMLITDPKGELFAENSKNLQEKNYNLFVFNLREPTKSNKYNPLSIIWDFYHKYLATQDTEFLDLTEALLRDLANTIAPLSKGSREPIWEIGAQNLIQGLSLALLEDSEKPQLNMTKDKLTLWQLLNLFTQGNDLLEDFVVRRPKESLSLQKTYKYVKNEAKETVDSFISQTTTKLNQFVDSGMTYLTSDTDIDLNELDKKPWAIFCIVPDENVARHPMASLFITQIYKYLIYLANENFKKSGIQQLNNDFYFILDEFGNLPQTPCIEQMLSIGGGRRIWTSIVIQSFGQLYEKYGKDLTSTLINNLNLQIYMGALDIETNKLFSEFLGYRTVRKNSVSLDSSDISINSKGLQGNTQMEKQALINPDELSRLSPGQIVLKVFKDQPCKTKLVPIFDQELQKKGVWNVGSIKTDVKYKAIDRSKVYYDLTERDNNYDTVEVSNVEGFNLDTKDIEDTKEIINNNLAPREILSTSDYIRILKGIGE